MVSEIIGRKKYDGFLYVGDVHNELEKLAHGIAKAGLRNHAIIQVGDFGAGLYPRVVQEPWAEMLNDILRALECDLYAIRGNHDNPAVFNNQWYWPNVFLAEDYTILNLDGPTGIKRIFCLGGAVSIDRRKKSEVGHWYPDEPVRIDESALDYIRDIDVMVSHTAPGYLPPMAGSYLCIVRHFAKNDSTLIPALQAERNNLTKFVDKIVERNPKMQHFVYGHFHFSNVLIIDGTKYTLLDIHEIKKIDEEIRDHIG